jgi:hypothetical protein
MPLSLQTLTTIEALLLSKSDPRWGEFPIVAGCIQEVQQAKQMLIQSRMRPAQELRAVPGPSEPSTPLGHKEVG